MTVLASWDTGALPTTAGSAVTAAPGAGPSGVDAIKFEQASGQVAQVQFPLTARTSVAVRAYMQLPSAWASASMTIIDARSSSTVMTGRALLAGSGTPGEVRLSKADPSANTAVSGTGKVAQSTWYRFELRVDQTAGRGRLGVFPLLSDTPIWDSGWVTADFGTSVMRVEVGPAQTTLTVGTMYAAAIVVSDDLTDWIGRAAWDATPAPTVSPWAAITAGGLVPLDLNML